MEELASSPRFHDAGGSEGALGIATYIVRFLLQGVLIQISQDLFDGE